VSKIDPPDRPCRFLACQHCPTVGAVAPESPVEQWVCPKCLRGRDELPEEPPARRAMRAR